MAASAARGKEEGRIPEEDKTRRARGGGRAAPLLKSRDPHLTGGEKWLSWAEGLRTGDPQTRTTKDQ